MRAKRTTGLVIFGAMGLWSITQTGCGSTPKPPPPAATGSGAFGVVTVGGKQLLYLPVSQLNDAGNSQVVVVDVGVGSPGTDGGTPAQVTTIDLGDAGTATASAGDATVVVAAGTYTYTVWFIDPTTNKVIDTLQLDPSLSQGSFSGGEGIVNGIAIDEAKHRAILSVWNGILFVDLGSHTVTGSVLAAGAENFGYDSSLEYVLLPFYDCGDTGELGGGDGGGATPPPCGTYVTLGDAGTSQPISNGLNLINLKTNQVFTYENPDAGDPTSPVGVYPDSAAVDSTTGLAVVTAEESRFYNFLDLTRAVFSMNGDAGIFSAPSSILTPMQMDDGVAVDPSSHFAFFEAEGGSHISVLDLTKVVAGTLGVGPGAFADAYLPNLPDGTGWSNLLDPHGIAVTTGIQSGDPVGFVVTDQAFSSDIFVARIDLNKMLTLGQAAKMTLTSDQLAPAITLLDATRKE